MRGYVSMLSFRQLVLFVLGMAFFVQSLVISYNHFSGYYVLHDYGHFLFRFFRGTLMSVVAGAIISCVDLFIIERVDRSIPWQNNVLNRVFAEFLIGTISVMLIGIFITLAAHIINPYTEPINRVLFYNALIYGVVNIVVIAIFEAWLLFAKNQHAQKEIKRIEEELFEIKFEVLKSQINPHFMFNSLNVLSSLIKNDIEGANRFIEEFSWIYRYVLEYIEKPLTTLSGELDFSRSYIFLQQIRYGDNLSVVIDVDDQYLDYMMPPLSLQVVLENALKHNVVNNKTPLTIKICVVDGSLHVSHILQPRVSNIKSTGIGQVNLYKRYALVCKVEPVFSILNDNYVAQLPLIY